MTADGEIVRMSAIELAGAFRERKISPLEVTRVYLDRIRTLDQALNSFCLVDHEMSMSDARASEKRFAAGSPLGALDGVPVAIKDLLLTRDWPTLRGSHLVPPAQSWTEDAPTVGRLRAQGAVFLGKTTTPEFGWKAVTDSPLTGVTRNPWNEDRTAGGSSGGSAAAVAAGLAPLALGTDGGGSIRIPSSFCGVVGLKPTVGLVPQWPSSPFGVLSHTGPIARTADDAALLLSVIAGESPQDPMTARPKSGDLNMLPFVGMKGLRIAFSPDLGYVDVQSEVREAVDRAAAALERLGARVELVDPGFSDPVGTFEILWLAGAARTLERYGTGDRARVDPGLAEIAERGASLSAADYVQALESRVSIAVEFDAFMDDYDLLLTPTTPLVAFDAGREVPEGWPSPRWWTWTPFTYPFNITGSPAVSVPCGISEQGLPIGLQLVGRRFEDAVVMRAAAEYGRSVEAHAAPMLRLT